MQEISRKCLWYQWQGFQRSMTNPPWTLMKIVRHNWEKPTITNQIRGCSRTYKQFKDIAETLARNMYVYHKLKSRKRYLWSWALIMSTRSWAVTLSLWVYIRSQLQQNIFIACLTRFWTNLRSKNLFSFPALSLHLESSNCLKNPGKLLCLFFYLKTKLQE